MRPHPGWRWDLAAGPRALRVVGVCVRQIRFVDRSRVAIFEKRRVHGGGIALQRSAAIKAVEEHRGDKRAFGRDRGFLFDQRGKGDEAVDVLPCRKSGGQRCPTLSKFSGHHAAELIGCGTMRYAISRREEITLQAWSKRVEITDAGWIGGGMKKASARTVSPLRSIPGCRRCCCLPAQ